MRVDDPAYPNAVRLYCRQCNRHVLARAFRNPFLHAVLLACLPGRHELARVDERAEELWGVERTLQHLTTIAVADDHISPEEAFRRASFDQ